MKITLVGTSAGEGYPGFWCNCVNCRKARELGGKNIRGNSCAMIDDDVMIDMNNHFFEVAVSMGIDPTKVKTLVVTHPHHDHFDPFYLAERGVPRDIVFNPDTTYTDRISPNFTPLPVLQVYGNAYVKKLIGGAVGNLLERQEDLLFRFHCIEDGKQEQADNLSILPIRSIHTRIDGEAHNYILERDGKTLLYASDTGGYGPDMLEILLNHQYDCVIMEGTFGLGMEIDGHMCLRKNVRMKKLLEEHGCLKPGCGFYLTHICPHWAPPHDEYARIVAGEGMNLGYDGEIIEI